MFYNSYHFPTKYTATNDIIQSILKIVKYEFYIKYYNYCSVVLWILQKHATTGMF